MSSRGGKDAMAGYWGRLRGIPRQEDSEIDLRGHLNRCTKWDNELALIRPQCSWMLKAPSPWEFSWWYAYNQSHYVIVWQTSHLEQLAITIATYRIITCSCHRQNAQKYTHQSTLWILYAGFTLRCCILRPRKVGTPSNSKPPVALMTACPIFNADLK